MSRTSEALLALPRLALLVPKLAADERVPARTKLALAGLAVYVASPWDLIPDFIPVLGQLDDLAAALLIADGILNQVEDKILLDHWTGEVETLRTLQWLSRQVSDWVPSSLKRVLFGRAVAAGRKRLRRKAATRA
ncbi:MAG: YkvA family protein [Terriglobia bacterium]